MRCSSLLSPFAGDSPSLLRLSLLLASLTPPTTAITFNPIPSANLDLSNLGRVGLAGDFNGISLYQFEGQNENGFITNGSQSVMARFPNGGFATLASADAGIAAMCPYIFSNGTLAGVVIGGNFTSLGDIESQGVALFNPNTSAITALPGLSGQVTALLCDESSNTVYVGGSFRGANSTNAIAWVGDSWANLPFAGFNGPVSSIAKASNGHIIFGGSFTGLGNATGPSEPDQQIVNISGANITSASSTTTTGFSDPRNIVCKTGGTDGTGNTWLLADDSPGFWRADFGFGFTPTKLRLWNTHQDGRGTKTFRYTAMPINGIMNLTYIDPDTGSNSSCSSECHLSSNSSVKYQDFHFVNMVGMDAFRIDISAWYGSGGGLDGIELFQDDIFAYAINDFNEPTCAGLSAASSATTSGPWTVSPSQQSVAEYLTATFDSTTVSSSSGSVVFYPDIRQSGNYSVNIYTPGCLQDNSCDTRGMVVVNGTMASGTTNETFKTSLYQTNDYDKYDQIYFGYIEAGSSSFRPSVTLSPGSALTAGKFTVVAQRVGFTLIDSTGGLNGIFEYNPEQAVINTSDFQNSTFDKAGMDLNTGAEVNAIVTSGSTTFVGGNFSTSTYKNILSISSSSTTSLVSGGLNGEVATMVLNDTTLFVAGNFSNTNTASTTGLNNVAAYDTEKNTWSALGAGVNGRVMSVVPISLNITANVPETVITLTGDFDELNAFGSNSSVSVNGFAIWVPSRSNWLQNLNAATMSINGRLTAGVNVSGEYFFAGSLSSSQLSANGVASLSSGLSPFPVSIQANSPSQSSSSLSKRDGSSTQNVTGVTTGLFYENGGRNITILGGHFTATASNGTEVNNLVFIDGANGNTVTGLGSSISNDSTFLALAVENDMLYAGGSVKGTVNGESVGGLISYNLKSSSLDTQAPALGGDSVVVNDIAVRTKTGDVYVGGSFTEAGSLDCPGVCLFTASTSQWNRPGTNLQGTANTMLWSSDSTLIVGGSLAVDGGNVSLASYDVKAQTWTAFNGASAIPGPVTALTAATGDISQLWVGGTATNGSAFLMKYDGSAWNSVGDVFESGTTVRGLQVMPLSQKHDSSNLVPSDQALMVTGSMVLPNFGNASAVLFNGTNLVPFALTSTAANTGGSLSQIFSQENNFFKSSGSHLAVGLVVLIALAIALALIFLLVVAGVLAERIRRKREGYMPAPTNSYDRMSRIPPQQLFSSLGHSRTAVEKAPMI
ncbi:cellular morphogenesis protein [Rutstroemia sp. NJR-2017a WRK4]|nr:cellular morphogenesis protein [Rutstroemia sp. NJR-2017a WRK4]